MWLDTAVIDTDNLETIVFANILAVGHTVVEGAGNMLVEECTGDAAIRNLLIVDTFHRLYLALSTHRFHYKAEVVVQLVGCSRGSLPQRGKLIAHATDKPEA